jgi:alanyl-tRNA synthetase
MLGESHTVTDRLFWEDPYATSNEAVVTTVNSADIELDRSVLFAFSGGQECDLGWIGGHRVLQARLDGARLIYPLPDGHGLQVDDPVQVVIDWECRYALMRLHFAAELVLEMVSAALPGVERIGAHIAQDKARIDIFWPTSIATLLPDIAWPGCLVGARICGEPAKWVAWP